AARTVSLEVRSRGCAGPERVTRRRGKCIETPLSTFGVRGHAANRCWRGAQKRAPLSSAGCATGSARPRRPVEGASFIASEENWLLVVRFSGVRSRDRSPAWLRGKAHGEGAPGEARG